MLAIYWIYNCPTDYIILHSRKKYVGRVGSPNRKSTFGYIDLNVKIIHPEIWDLVITLNPAIGKIALGKKRFFINEKGDLEESPNQFVGLSGINDLIENWDKLNLSVVGKKHPENVSFLKKNRERIFIDKILVLPAGIKNSSSLI